jgi:hypothetical protein
MIQVFTGDEFSQAKGLEFDIRCTIFVVLA